MKKFLTVSAVVLAFLSMTAWASVTMRDLIITASTFTNGIITSSTINSSTVGAATPSTGVFTSLNSTSGALNGSIGGTTPSAGTFTTGVFGSSLTDNALGTSSLVCTSSGVFTTSCGATPRTCNVNGCFKISTDGTIEEWGQTANYGGAVEGTFGITFPLAFSSGAVSAGQVSVTISPTACNGTGGACGSGIHPNTLTPQSSTLTTGGITVFYDGNGSTVQTSTGFWHAVGY